MEKISILILIVLSFVAIATGGAIEGISIVDQEIREDWVKIEDYKEADLLVFAENIRGREEEVMPQLFARILILEEELCKKDNTYSWCT